MYVEKAGLSTQEHNEAEATTRKLERIWGAKLEKLCRLRFGNHNLPDNDDGRAMLTALLCFGMTDAGATEDAFWSVSELPALRRKARRLRWREIGRLIGLTYDERETCKLWIFDPCDVSPDEVKRRQAEKRKASDSARKKRQREQRRHEREQIRAANSRSDAVLRMLEGKHTLAPQSPGATPPRFLGEWTTLSTLVKLLIENTRAFRRPDGRQLRNPRDAVHRTVKQLVKSGAVQTRLEQGQRGVIVLARKPVAVGKADAFCDGRSVASVLPEKAQKTRSFEPQPALSAGNADMVPMAHDNPTPSSRKVVSSKRRKAS